MIKFIPNIFGTTQSSFHIDETEKKLLPAQPPEHDSVDEHPSINPRTLKRVLLFLYTSLSFNLVLLALLVSAAYHNKSLIARKPEVVSSPAQHLINKYEIIEFENDSQDKVTEWANIKGQVLDEHWEILYNDTFYRMERSDLIDLVGEAADMSGADDGKWIYGLYVFHQLHCLDKIRQALRPLEYPNHVGYPHLDHCINQLRQATMCTSDVTPMIWHYNKEEGHWVIWANMPHRCRVFEPINQWAKFNFSGVGIPGVV